MTQPIERVGTLTTAQFQSDFLQLHRPIVISGGVASWPALRLWSHAYLKQHAGYVEVTLRSKADYANGVSKREDEPEHQIDLATALDQLAMEDVPDFSYIRESDLIMQAQHLSLDITTPDILPKSFARPLPRHLPSRTGCVGPIAWIGPAGTVAQLHWDPEHNLFAQVRGRKYVILTPPTGLPNSYPNLFPVEALATKYRSRIPTTLLGKLTKTASSSSGDQNTAFRILNFQHQLANQLTPDEVSILCDLLLDLNVCHVNAETPDSTIHPAYGVAVRYEATLLPGDLLFIPYLWLHYLRSLDPSISINWFFPPTSAEADTYGITLATMVSHLAP